MSDSLLKLRLMHLSSASLPVGAFTWSQGLEWACEDGWIKNNLDFKQWQETQLHQSFLKLEIPVLSRLYKAAQEKDLAQFTYWTNYLIACRETSELRTEEASRGIAFSKVLTSWGFKPSDDWSAPIIKSQLSGMAWLGTQWQIPLYDLALSSAYSWIESAVMAGVKLVPFGQNAAQVLILELCESLSQTLQTALSLDDDDIGACTPLSAIASSKHETQYSRIFRS